MKNLRNITGFVLCSLLLACQFPQTQPSSSGSPSSPSSSPPSGQPPSGSPPSSPPPGQPPPSGSAGEAGSEGSPSSPPPSSSESGSSEGASSDGATMGEQMPLPAGAAGESGLERLEDLDSQLDDALGDFDETMGESSAANSNGGAEQEIDILNPMTSGGSSSQNDEPLYDDGGPEGSGGQDGESGSIENEGIAQRAAQGADSGGQQGSASGSEGAESGSQSGGQQGSDSGSEGAESGSQSDGQQGSASASAGGASGASSADGQQAGSDSGDGAGSVIPVPEDVGDGRNDDIVLRQIREAALHEKDPVLRERLWEEYRRIRDQK